MSKSKYNNQLADIIKTACVVKREGLFFCDERVLSGMMDDFNPHKYFYNENEEIAFSMVRCDAHTKEEQDVIDKLKSILYETSSDDIGEIKNNVRKLTDNMQDVTDVINLFADIDKNRNSTDDKIENINKRLDKIEQMLVKLIEKD